MAMIEWSDALALGLPEIDRHHEQLVRLTNTTCEEIKKGTSRERIGEVLDELLRYAKYHFDCEERWFEEISYSDSALHEAEHLNFIRRVAEIQATFRSGGTGVSFDILAFLMNWISNHIFITDTEYAIALSDTRAATC
ncbi:bacteriohemerythrin [Geomesophilobacter sediminis]|uniref:Hemerythrin family protein n=1 Tax=Geomesophilobacter sediminis TaxID=2798584 RepID=A0A8J7JE68_9BACT|nr:bacteriohemerythrin [Geomesophilobacter sediminis]MBJ6725753.1 hemerythrin family protein [Geomesophilobacter sediminis]